VADPTAGQRGIAGDDIHPSVQAYCTHYLERRRIHIRHRQGSIGQHSTTRPSSRNRSRTAPPSGIPARRTAPPPVAVSPEHDRNLPPSAMSKNSFATPSTVRRTTGLGSAMARAKLQRARSPSCFRAERCQIFRPVLPLKSRK
jgi:hypothetical protein